MVAVMTVVVEVVTEELMTLAIELVHKRSPPLRLLPICTSKIQNHLLKLRHVASSLYFLALEMAINRGCR